MSERLLILLAFIALSQAILFSENVEVNEYSMIKNYIQCYIYNAIYIML